MVVPTPAGSTVRSGILECSNGGMIRGKVRYFSSGQSRMLTCLMPAKPPPPMRSMVSSVLGWLSAMAWSAFELVR